MIIGNSLAKTKKHNIAKDFRRLKKKHNEEQNKINQSLHQNLNLEPYCSILLAQVIIITRPVILS